MTMSSYITLSPFFYYIIHESDIKQYIIIASEGSLPYMVKYPKLKELVEQFVITNSHGIDKSIIDQYVLFICDRLLTNVT